MGFSCSVEANVVHYPNISVDTLLNVTVVPGTEIIDTTTNIYILYTKDVAVAILIIM